MEIKKDTILDVNHKRKGKFIGIVLEDFDSEKEEFYPIAVAQFNPVRGMANDWEVMEKIPCRATLCEISVKK